MPVPLRLREYEVRSGVELSQEQIGQLRALTNSISISPSLVDPAKFDLKAGSQVGAIRLDDLDVIIEPKLNLDRLLFVLSYGLGNVRSIADPIDLDQADDLPEAIVVTFVHHVNRALRRGVQQGYRVVDDSSLTLRGRLRVGDQIRRRFGPIPPAEVTFDDFTVDIEINRLLRAAAERLLRLRLRSSRSHVGLRGVVARLEGVELTTYDPRAIPSVRFTRLNERYRDAVALARLILSSSSFDLGPGAVPASAFLVDMNTAFEDFVVAALRDALGMSSRQLMQGRRGARPLFLDTRRKVRLEPDLSVWNADCCLFVGDVKYKRIVPDGFPNADIYQATAYAVASGLPSAMLIYAASEGDPATHQIVQIDKDIHVVAIDLTAPPAKLLRQIRALAAVIRQHAVAAHARLAA